MLRDVKKEKSGRLERRSRIQPVPPLCHCAKFIYTEKVLFFRQKSTANKFPLTFDLLFVLSLFLSLSLSLSFSFSFSFSFSTPLYLYPRIKEVQNRHQVETRSLIYPKNDLLY